MRRNNKNLIMGLSLAIVILFLGVAINPAIAKPTMRNNEITTESKTAEPPRTPPVPPAEEQVNEDEDYCPLCEQQKQEAVEQIKDEISGMAEEKSGQIKNIEEGSDGSSMNEQEAVEQIKDEISGMAEEKSGQIKNTVEGSDEFSMQEQELVEAFVELTGALDDGSLCFQLAKSFAQSISNFIVNLIPTYDDLQELYAYWIENKDQIIEDIKDFAITAMLVAYEYLEFVVDFTGFALIVTGIAVNIAASSYAVVAGIILGAIASGIAFLNIPGMKLILAGVLIGGVRIICNMIDCGDVIIGGSSAASSQATQSAAGASAANTMNSAGATSYGSASL